jgi:predicted permease
MLVSTLGGAMGLLVAFASARALLAVGPASLREGVPVAMNLSVLAFAMLLAVGSAMVFGLLPAIRISKASPGAALREAGRGNAGSPRSRLWGFLIAGEVAMAVILLVASGLIIRSFRNMMEVDTGFDPRPVTTIDFALPSALYPNDDVIREFHERVMPAMRALPGVTAAGYINHLPLSGFSMNGALEIEGVGDAPGYADYRVASDDYFASLSIPMLAGRDFDVSVDRPDAPPVVIVNEAFVRSLLPQGTTSDLAVGKRIRNLRNESWYYGADQWLTIVGVVGDVRHGGPLSSPTPEAYVHVLQRSVRAGAGYITIRVNSAGLAGSIRSAVREVAPDVPFEIVALEARSTGVVAERRFGMLVLAGFAGLALCLGAIGIYGVVSYSVERRRREMGVRLALGATPGAVVARTITRSLISVGAGVLLGIPAALLAARLLRGMLFGVALVDPVTLVAVVAGLAGVALLASWLPARRVASIDPVATLRAE